ncbi:hypothetical protein J1614_010194 [Plenodomus biglobosus]|nr:hypothetical protein J1614_010194 [Plenodomus biglobosus]
MTSYHIPSHHSNPFTSLDYKVTSLTLDRRRFRVKKKKKIESICNPFPCPFPTTSNHLQDYHSFTFAMHIKIQLLPM